MMASDILYIVFVVLCALYSVHCYSLTGIIHRRNGAESALKESNYIEGGNWGIVRDFTLDQLEGAETLPSLTLANFRSIQSLYLTNIALQHVPIFVNTSCDEIYITGNKIKSVPAKAFVGPAPSYLELSNNEIQLMADGSVNMDAKSVNLKCNKISRFSQFWFEDPASIMALDLDSNRINYIPDRAFNQMTMLQIVDLSRNQITSIGSEAFNSGIQQLFLQFNGIAWLTLDMFADRDKSLTELYLHHNQLSYLPEALLLRLKPRFISLFGNPWQCQCLQDIERWLRDLNSVRYDIASRRDEPVCVVPVNFQNVCVPAVDWELQQTYASGLAPVPECLATGCKPCSNTEFYFLTLTSDSW